MYYLFVCFLNLFTQFRFHLFFELNSIIQSLSTKVIMQLIAACWPDQNGISSYFLCFCLLLTVFLFLKKYIWLLCELRYIKLALQAELTFLFFLNKYLKTSLMYSINIYLLPLPPLKQVRLGLDHSLL